MTWNILDNLADGQRVEEVHMDEIRENIEHLGSMKFENTALSGLALDSEIGYRIGGRWHRTSSNQSLGTGTWDTVVTDTARFAVGVSHSSGQITINKAGRYYLEARAEFASYGSGDQALRIYRNSSEQIAISTAGVNRYNQVFTVWNLNASDTIDFQAYSSIASNSILHTDYYSCEIAVYRLGG